MNYKKKIRDIVAVHLPFFLSAPAVLWQVLFLYIPLLFVFYISLRQGSDAAWYQLTFSHYTTFFDIIYLRIIGRSIALAFCVAFFCLLCAYPIAYFLALKVGHAWKNFLLFLLTLPFWTNFLVQVYAWFFVLDRNGILNTLLLASGIIKEPLYLANNMYSVFVVMVYCYLPFMIMPLYSILEKIQHDLLEASMDLGATHWQTFKRITIPLSLSGIQTGVFLVFVPAFGEFAIPLLIGGSKYMTVGSLISHYFLVAQNDELGSALTILTGITLLMCALVFNWFCTFFIQARPKGRVS